VRAMLRNPVRRIEAHLLGLTQQKLCAADLSAVMIQRRLAKDSSICLSATKILIDDS
jgi:hypothetical protein